MTSRNRKSPQRSQTGVKTYILSATFLVVVLVVLLIINTRALDHVYDFLYAGFLNQSTDISTISFVGDVFLGRDVETKMGRLGYSYPFAGDELLDNEVGVLNFESSASNNHWHTPNYTFAFSVQQQILPQLEAAGYRFASLANNHALDAGVVGRNETVAALEAVGVAPFGVPSAPYEIITLGSLLIGVAGFNDVTDRVTKSVVEQVIYTMSQETDVQIAYIHWGVEYEPRHSVRQEELAKLLIDSGFDCIIGHHPHVVQDIDWYQGVPIFYSLGNYVFDQYFSTEVRQGLRVRLHARNDALLYELVPVTSEDTYIQPQPLLGVRQESFLSNLAAKSNAEIADMVASGYITQQIK